MKRAGLVALLLVGCATSEDTSASIVLSSGPVAQLMGLSQDNLRATLGAEGGDTEYITSIRLEPGVRVSKVHWAMLVDVDACPRSHTGRDFHAIEADGTSWRVTNFTFHDDRLVEVEAFARGEPRTLSLEASYSLECSLNSQPDQLDQALLGATALLLLGPVMGAAAVHDAATDESDVRQRALSMVRLGQPLPGGVDGYVAEFAGVVHLARREGDDADLDLALYPRSRWEGGNVVRIEMRAGIVTGVIAKPWHRCELDIDGEFHCPGRG